LKRKKTPDFVRTLDFNHSLRKPLVPYRQAQIAVLKREKEKKEKERLASPKDRWDDRSYNASSYFMSRSEDEPLNLLALDNEGKENNMVEHLKVATIPTKIERPTQIGSNFKTQLSDDHDDDANKVTINQLIEQTVKEQEAKRNRLDNEDTKLQAMINAIAGYPGEEEVDTQEINPPQPEMGTSVSGLARNHMNGLT
jgi:hypothetical protein